MEREVFENHDCAALLNVGFISIKVDREERPDIDNIYMESCQNITGSGGWPLSIFLTPDKLPFFAGTYMPPERFNTVVGQLTGLWRSDRNKLDSAAKEIMQRLKREREPVVGVSLSAETVLSAYESLKRRFDYKNGGFGGAPKFPSAHVLMFLKRYGMYYKKQDAINMADVTMDKMALGGIFDHIGGGFCRYSTDKFFLVPHFEKMLYDNAMLAILYAESGRNVIAQHILDYCLLEMRDTLGGFYTAQDADSEGVEGKFYTFSPDEIMSVLGYKDGKRFCDLYDITENGNYEGKSIPNLMLSGKLNENDEEFAKNCRGKIYKYRAGRVPPFTDKKILASSNGLMIAALATAGRMMKNESYIEHAKTTANFILNNMLRGGRLYSVWCDECLPHKATLDDYAYLMWGVFRLHQATLDNYWLDKVIQLGSDMERLFSDDRGMFYYAGSDVTDLPIRTKNGFDGALPSGSSIAAGVFLRLWQITGEEHYIKSYIGIIDALVDDAEKYPTAFCSLLSTYILAEHGGFKVEIRGSKEKYSDVTSEFHPFVTWKAESGDGEVYVCHGGACRKPVNTPEELSAILNENTIMVH